LRIAIQPQNSFAERCRANSLGAEGALGTQAQKPFAG
jgi:hypothetical protein